MRAKPSLGDLARSVAVVAVIALVIWYFGDLRSGEDPVHTIDIGPTLSSVPRVAAYDVLVPSGLSDDWRPTSARITPPETGRRSPTELHVGWVTPDDDFAALEESDGPSAPFVRSQTKSGTVEGTQIIDGRTWERRVSGDQRSLVLVDDGVAVVVTGSAEWDELTTLAAALNEG